MRLPFILLGLLFGLARAYDILALFPYNGKSHFLVFQPLLQELATRGHRVTVISYFPLSSPPPNYTDYPLRDPAFGSTEAFDLSPFEMKTMGALDTLQQLWRLQDTYQDAFSQIDFKALRKQHFDVALVELFNTDMFLSIPHQLGIPYIGVSSCEIMPWTSEALGNPDNPSWVPNLITDLPGEMSFLERLQNTLTDTLCHLVYSTFFKANGQTIAEKNLGPLPPTSDIAKNVSAILLNTHYSLSRPRPFLPSVIQVGGIHVAQPKPLSQELEEKLSTENRGTIYFSLGSMVNSSSMSMAKRDIFINVFKKLPYTILWKWGGEMPNKPENVITSPWFPQRDILAHPKVVLFITHGGLLGTNEAVCSGVPILGFPLYGDQFFNINGLLAAGVGLKLEYSKLTEKDLYNAITSILNTSSYKENAERLKAAFLDRPLSPMDTAIYWIEHIVRNKGAPLLKSHSRFLSWYQFMNIDVYLLIVFMALLTSYTSYWIIIKTSCSLGKSQKTKKL